MARPTFLIALTVLLSCTVGCCTDPVNGGLYFCLFDPSDAEEAKMGLEYAPNFVAQSGGEYPDPELESYLGDIVIEKMARRSHRPDLPWQFRILNTSQVNAFALPGGQVFVTRGLLAMLETEAQFAHLMGHEVGHVSHRHALKGQGRNVLTNIIVGTVGMVESTLPTRGPDDPLWLTGATGAVASLAGLHYSREQELESDERGVDYAYQAGYDPREATKTFALFLKLKEDAGQGESVLNELLATHPLDSRRIDAINDYIEETLPAVAAGEADLVVSGPEWETHLGRVQKAQDSYAKYDKAIGLINKAAEAKNQQPLDEAEVLLRDGRAALPRHAPFHVGLATVALSRDSYGEALRHGNDAAALDPDHFEAQLLRGVALRHMGKFDEALTALTRAHELFPMAPPPCFLLGDVEEHRGDLKQAESWYRACIERSPRGSPVREQARQRIETLGERVKRPAA